MLLLSAGTTFLYGAKLWTAASTGTLPLWVAATPTVCFIAFVGVYTFDRLFLVKKRGYSATRALFQIALAVIFLTTLLPDQASNYKSARAQRLHLRPVSHLLEHKDPSVRAAACELLSWRAETQAMPKVFALTKHDKSNEVQTVCREALSKLRSISQSSPQIPQP